MRLKPKFRSRKDIPTCLSIYIVARKISLPTNQRWVFSYQQIQTTMYEGYGGNPSSDSRIRTTGLRKNSKICPTSVRFGHSQGLIQLDYASRRGVCLRDVCHRLLYQAFQIGEACQTSKRMYLNDKRPARWRGACEKLDSDLQQTRVSADYPIEFFPCKFLDSEPNGSLSRGLIFRYLLRCFSFCYNFLSPIIIIILLWN